MVWRVLSILLVAMLPLDAIKAVEAGHMLNVRDADIRNLIEAVAQATGKNFVVDPRVKGQVTVISAKPLERDALYETFLSVLQIHEFSAIPAGNVIKIVPSTSARTMAAQSHDGSGDALVTHVIALKHVPVGQLQPLLRPLMPDEAQLIAYDRGNLLIVSDRAANVGRLLDIVGRMDIALDDALEVIPLRHAKADDIAKLVNSSAGTATEAGTVTAPVLPDARTNSLILTGQADARLKIRALISVLDVQAPATAPSDLQTSWTRLRHARATAVAGMLKEYLDGTPGGDSASSAAGIQIYADEQANALLLKTSALQQAAVTALLREVDRAPSQVLVEAIIAEMSEDQSRTLGFEWAGATRGMRLFSDFPNTLGVSLGRILPALSGSTVDPIPSLPGGTAAGGFSKGDARFLAILKALESDSDTKILSTPSLVTLDQHEAQISIGQEVPFITGSFASTGANQGSANPFQTLERKDVGLKLRITPRVVDEHMIQLSIYQEVSSLANSTQAADVITNKRTLATQVQVENEQVLGLGGLLDDRKSETEDRIPVLGRLPLIGALFRGRNARHTHQNLMIFLRARLLGNAQVTPASPSAPANNANAQVPAISTAEVRAPRPSSARHSIRPFAIRR